MNKNKYFKRIRTTVRHQFINILKPQSYDEQEELYGKVVFGMREKQINIIV